MDKRNGKVKYLLNLGILNVLTLNALYAGSGKQNVKGKKCSGSGKDKEKNNVSNEETEEQKKQREEKEKKAKEEAENKEKLDKQRQEFLDKLDKLDKIQIEFNSYRFFDKKINNNIISKEEIKGCKYENINEIKGKLENYENLIKAEIKEVKDKLLEQQNETEQIINKKQNKIPIDFKKISIDETCSLKDLSGFYTKITDDNIIAKCTLDGFKKHFGNKIKSFDAIIEYLKDATISNLKNVILKELEGIDEKFIKAKSSVEKFLTKTTNIESLIKEAIVKKNTQNSDNIKILKERNNSLMVKLFHEIADYEHNFEHTINMIYEIKENDNISDEKIKIDTNKTLDELKKIDKSIDAFKGKIESNEVAFIIQVEKDMKKLKEIYGKLSEQISNFEINKTKKVDTIKTDINNLFKLIEENIALNIKNVGDVKKTNIVNDLSIINNIKDLGILTVDAPKINDVYDNIFEEYFFYPTDFNSKDEIKSVISACENSIKYITENKTTGLDFIKKVIDSFVGFIEEYDNFICNLPKFNEQKDLYKNINTLYIDGEQIKNMKCSKELVNNVNILNIEEADIDKITNEGKILITSTLLKNTFKTNDKYTTKNLKKMYTNFLKVYDKNKDNINKIFENLDMFINGANNLYGFKDTKYYNLYFKDKFIELDNLKKAFNELTYLKDYKGLKLYEIIIGIKNFYEENINKRFTFCKENVLEFEKLFIGSSYNGENKEVKDDYSFKYEDLFLSPVIYKTFDNLRKFTFLYNVDNYVLNEFQSKIFGLSFSVIKNMFGDNKKIDEWQVNEFKKKFEKNTDLYNLFENENLFYFNNFISVFTDNELDKGLKNKDKDLEKAIKRFEKFNKY